MGTLIWTWHRKHENGYEVSSKGDKRFSAFNATLSDGRTVEQHYQCDVKGYDPGGVNWRLGKGKPPLQELTQGDLWELYLSLWDVWVQNNLPLMRELYVLTKDHKILTDCFATTEINQAHAISTILNRLCS